MSLPVSASVPNLAMTVPTGFAAALGIWLATTTALLLAEAGLARCTARARLFSAWRALAATEARDVLRREQQCVNDRQRSGARPANRQSASAFQISRILLRIAAFAFGLGVTLPTLAQTISGSSLDITGQSTLQGDLVTCSGHPWIDVRCNGAVADGNHDDTNAINSTISAAIANNWPVRLTAGTYKVTSRIIIDYATQAGQGFRLVSDGAVIDGRTIASGPVLQIQCGGGTTSSPTGCFYFKEEGSLFVNGNTPAYVVVVGKTDFSDAHNSAKFDHLIVNNANSAAAGGGCQFNYVLDSDIFAVCVATGGAAGLAFEQVQFSRISGAGTAEGIGGRGVVLENGYNFSNTFLALDLEVSPTCLSITFNHNGLNTFVSPYFNCVTAVNATASDGNVLINPNYGGATVNYGPLSTGMSVIGTGSRDNWLFPVAGSYVAKPIDDGLTSRAITLRAHRCQ